MINKLGLSVVGDTVLTLTELRNVSLMQLFFWAEAIDLKDRIKRSEGYDGPEAKYFFFNIVDDVIIVGLSPDDKGTGTSTAPLMPLSCVVEDIRSALEVLIDASGSKERTELFSLDLLSNDERDVLEDVRYARDLTHYYLGGILEAAKRGADQLAEKDLYLHTFNAILCVYTYKCLLVAEQANSEEVKLC